MARWTRCADEMPEKGVAVLTKGKGSDIIHCLQGETLEAALERTNNTEWHDIGFYSEDGWCDYSGFPMIIAPKEWKAIDWSDYEH